MPAINPVLIMGAMKFGSAGLVLPVDWKPPRDPEGKKHYDQAIPPAERLAVPALMPPWFRAAESTKGFQKIADDVGREFKDFHDRMCNAVKFAHQMWLLQAKFGPMTIVGPSVVGPPGSLQGPSLESNIKNAPSTVGMMPKWNKYRDAVAGGVAQCFQTWQMGVSCPGLPLYPGYAVLPTGPAPPMPAITMSLAAFVSPGLSMITVASTMKMAMWAKISEDHDRQQIGALFDAIATVLTMAFTIWSSTQMVSLVMGSGAVAGFPVGPVAGMTQPTPGHLIS